MLEDRKATAVPEWVVVLGVVILLGAAVLVAVLTGAGTQGNAVKGWIEGLGVPSVP